jgi:hypothetical protein
MLDFRKTYQTSYFAFGPATFLRRAEYLLLRLTWIKTGLVNLRRSLNGKLRLRHDLESPITLDSNNSDGGFDEAIH